MAVLIVRQVKVMPALRTDDPFHGRVFVQSNIQLLLDEVLHGLQYQLPRIFHGGLTSSWVLIHHINHDSESDECAHVTSPVSFNSPISNSSAASATSLSRAASYSGVGHT